MSFQGLSRKHRLLSKSKNNLKAAGQFVLPLSFPGANQSMKSNGRSRRAGKINQSSVKQKVIEVPYGTLNVPSVEETGYPKGGSLEERDAHAVKYGRVAVHPKAVADMLAYHGQTDQFVSMIAGLTNANHPDATQFFVAIGEMLAWVPDPEKKYGYETNFARKARNSLAKLDHHLDAAITKLQELQTAYKNYKDEKSAISKDT